MNKSGNFSVAICIALALTLAPNFNLVAQSSKFESGKLAVLRVGDGSSELLSRQNPVFIDQYDCNAPSQDHPSFSVALPTSGPNALWINGHAATEGGLERSADHRLLTVSGYCGDILSKKGTPSRLDYDRGICAVGADGTVHLIYKGSKWYGHEGDKTNPRDVVSDGANNFWGAGSAMGILFYNSGNMLQFGLASSTRAIKIINNTLYVSMTASDGIDTGKDGLAGGIYNFADSSGTPVALPKAAGAAMTLMIPAVAPYNHTTTFDINPQGDVAYVADAAYGIQKYIKTGGNWKLAYNLYIPGYDGPKSGILANPPNTKVRAGCFGLAVDFSSTHPILYATTTDTMDNQGANLNANRLIRIEDASSATSGETITNLAQTLATASSTNIVFRAIAFTPEAKP